MCIKNILNKIIQNVYTFLYSEQPVQPVQSEQQLPEEHIQTVMDHTRCERAEAVAALRKHKDDIMEAVLELKKM